MHGRLAMFAKIVTATAFVGAVVGCQPPRVKVVESIHAATETNPPRDFSKEPLDPYSWGGIAMASGGRDTRTTYGALSQTGTDGVDEVYLPTAARVRKILPDDTTGIYMVPDPRKQNKVAQRLGSRYLDNDGNDITPNLVVQNPPRSSLVQREKPAPAEAPKGE